MLVTYVVVTLAYVFAAFSGAVLISFINHLDPQEPQHVEAPAAPTELKLAS